MIKGMGSIQNHEAVSTIALDLDGTLTDPGEGIFACVRHALRALNLPVPTDDSLRAWIGPPLLGSFTAWYDEIGADKDPHQALALYRERFSAVGLFENEVYPGMEAALDGLREAGHRLYLATSKPEVYARRITSHFGLDTRLQGVYGSELDGRRADKVELLRHILAREGIDPATCAMVGDREYDMRAARAHGMLAVGVLWGYGSQRELEAAGAQALATNPQHLLDILTACRNDKPR